MLNLLLLLEIKLHSEISKSFIPKVQNSGYGSCNIEIFWGQILCVLKKMLATKKKSCFKTKPSEAVCMLMELLGFFSCLLCLLTLRDEKQFFFQF